MTFWERITSKISPFFLWIRGVALTIGAIGTAIALHPQGLPPSLTAIAGYMITAGAVATVLSQTTTPEQTKGQALETSINNANNVQTP